MLSFRACGAEERALSLEPHIGNSACEIIPICKPSVYVTVNVQEVRVFG